MAEMKCKNVTFKQLFRYQKILPSSIKVENSEENVIFYNENILSNSGPPILKKALET